MWKKIEKLIFDQQESSKPKIHKDEELHIAASALLVEAALMDGKMDKSERERIINLLKQEFNYDSISSERLLREAIRRNTDTQEIYSFVQLITKNFNYSERLRIIEMIWEVVYSDGKLHDYESSLVRRLVGLLHIEARDSVDAKNKALKSLRLKI